MKKDEILYNLRETAKKLGGISRNTIMMEINEGKLKACWRGKRMFVRPLDLLLLLSTILVYVGFYIVSPTHYRLKVVL